MGQYYRGCCKESGAKTWKGLVSYDFNNGAKLMEHSYIGNSFVEAFMSLIYRNPMRVVWAGDYADNEKGKEDNIYGLCKTIDKSNVQEDNGAYNFVVNHTKKLFIDLSKPKKDKWGYAINPLPLLTADGNGRGGGDYNGTDMDLIGTWARDFISVESEKPSADFEEFVSEFKENY